MTLQIHVNECDVVYVLAGVLQSNGGKLKEAEDFKCVFFVYSVLESKYRSAPVCELLSNNSLFVGQLYEDKSLALRTRDLIFFTTDLQTQQFTASANLFLKSLSLSLYNNMITKLESTQTTL